MNRQPLGAIKIRLSMRLKMPILTRYSAYSNEIVILRSDSDSLRDSECESSRFFEVENEDLK